MMRVSFFMYLIQVGCKGRIRAHKGHVRACKGYIRVHKGRVRARKGHVRGA